jgi:DNA-binding NarL/FixJ family response regulator
MTAMLFGRDAEIALLEVLLDAATSGPAVCVLEGTAGIGKTAVWRESVESARRRGYLVLETAPSEPEASVAFAGLGDLFDRIPDGALGGLPEVQAGALRAALSQTELPDGLRDLQALPRAMLHVLRELSAAGPTMVAIDNEQWLDPASARVLTFALSRLRDERIVVILARRRAPGGMLAVELGRRFGGRRLERIPLEPLPIDAIKRLIDARLDRSISTPVLRRIHQTAGGNPLWALAIALELQCRRSGAHHGNDLPIPRTLTDAVELRLRYVDPRAHKAMLAIAALSQPTLATLQAAMPQFALSDLESAEQAGVLEIEGDRVRFIHPLLASIHYHTTPPSKRRAMHRLLATVITDEEERAQHIALGAEAPDRRVGETLEKAARVAARRGATETAAQLLEDAARLTPIDQVDARTARIVASAEHRFRSGELSRARHMLAEVMSQLAAGPLKARARLQLAEMSADEPRVAMELLEGALPDSKGDDRLRIQIEWELITAARDIGQLAAARAYAESALGTAERLKDEELVARALSELLVTLVITGEPIDEDLVARLSAVEYCTTWTSYYQPATTMAEAWYFSGSFERARPELERAAQRALSRGEEWDRMGLELSLAGLEWQMGNPLLAEHHRQAVADAIGEFVDMRLWLFVMDATRALWNGDLLAARRNVEEGLALAGQKGNRWLTGRLVPILAEVGLRAGHFERAHALLKEERDWLRSSGFGPAGYLKATIWSLDFEALIALRRLEEAEDVLTELWSRARACRSDHLRAIASRSEAMLLAARGDVSTAIDAMDDALSAHLRCPRPFEQGRTLLEKGSIERRAKHKSAAKRTLEQALAILEPLGPQIWVSRTRDELSRIGLRRPTATDGLTPAQSRVTELVKTGSTNAQIARELHMSVRTVESHLSRIYREHGVTSRSQLIACLGNPHSPAA